MDQDITRRQALSRLALTAAGLAASCRVDEASAPETLTGGVLTARPGVGGPLPPRGTHRLNIAETRDALLYVPPLLPPDEPVPLVVALHGSPSSAEGPIDWCRESAAEFGFLVMAPSSRGLTWDALVGRFGPDVAFIDEALAATFAMCHVDPARIGLAGFSDGGSYSLALGLANGDLFPRIVSLSPGFLSNVARVGTPAVYIAHGTQDPVLPIDRSSLQIVPILRNAGYEVTFREFPGGHVLYPPYVREGLRWVIGGELGSPAQIARDALPTAAIRR